MFLALSTVRQPCRQTAFVPQERWRSGWKRKIPVDVCVHGASVQFQTFSTLQELEQCAGDSKHLSRFSSVISSSMSTTGSSSPLKDRNASNIGLYPVHRQMFPSRTSFTSSFAGAELFLSKLFSSSIFKNLETFSLYTSESVPVH